ncbi:MAG: hypothetical protein KDD52_00075 [Bdellovibrionales bacterium]|nr:hypothetical protein [Bdellovibrionales bacterium]
MKYYSLLIFLIASLHNLSSVTFAQEKICSVAFTIKEKGSKKKISNASMFLLPEGLEKISDDQGQLSYDHLSCTTHAWVINLTGYLRRDLEINVEDSMSKTIFLEAASSNEFETIVTADKNTRDGSKRSIAQKDFISAIGSRGDPIIALENEVGFSGFGSQGGVVLQGADPEDTRFYIHGHEIPLIFHNLGFSSILIPDVVDSVQLYTAGFGAEYGRSIGGNVNLETVDPRSDRIHGMSYVDLLNAAALVEGPIADHHSFWMGGRISYIGPIFSLVTMNDDSVSFNQVPQFFDLEAQYKWDISKNLQFDLLGIGSKDTVNVLLRNTDDPYFKGELGSTTAFYRFIPRIQYTWNEQNRFELSMGLGKDYVKFSLGDQFFDAEIFQPTLRSEWEQHWNDQWISYVGLDFQYLDFQADVNLPAGSFPNAEDENVPLSLRDVIVKEIEQQALQAGAYLRVDFLTQDQIWRFSPNLRFDYFGLTHNLHIQPRLEIESRIDKHWRARLSGGLYHQAPQPAELESSFGNPDLEDPYALHYVVSALMDFRDKKAEGLYGDFSIFYKDLYNLVVDSDALITRNGSLVPQRYSNDGSGYSIGNQWSLRYNKGRWSHALAYTLLWSEKFSPDEALYPSLGEQRHNANLRSTVKLGNWSLGARLRVISGQRYTPVLSAAYDADQDIFLPSFGARNSRRGPLFYQLDLRLDRKWIYDQWILSFYLDIQNVTNRNNPFEVEYNFDYSEQEYSSGIPILPTFGIKGEF